MLWIKNTKKVLTQKKKRKKRMSNSCATPKGTRNFQKEYIESNKKVYRKRKHTKELLVAAFWKPVVSHHGFVSQSWNLIGRQIYGNPLCSIFYKYPHRTYPSLHNEFKQSLFKHQSQERVKKIQKHVFNHCCSSHTLQRYYLFIFLTFFVVVLVVS